jgi:hypothetical protein
MTDRGAEIIEAILLLADLNKSPEFIGQQVGKSPEAVRDIIKTGRLPATQKTLSGDPIEPPKKKPETRVASWVQACRK